MKPSFHFLATALAIVKLTSLGYAAAPAPTLRAGAAAVDITPQEFPLNMPGGFSANMATSAHDPLHARALVLESGTMCVAMVVVDTMSAGPEVLDEAKAIASERTRIPVSRMLVCSTHTHTAPAHPKEGPAPAVAYRKTFVAGISDSIIRAHGALQPAALGAASHALPEEVFNRRWFLKEGKMPLNPFGKMDAVKMNPGTSPEILDHPAGPTDPDIDVLSIQDPKRKPLALFANYALHYVGGSPRAQISADYFGEFARVFPSRVNAGPEFVAMMSNGASGNINNIPFNVVRPPREPFEQIRIVAQKAADTAWMALRKIEKHRSDIEINMVQRDVVLKYRRPTEEQVAEARAVLAIMDKAALERLPPLAQNYARNTVGAFERVEETLTVQLQVIQLGEVAVCAVPFETFVEMGLDLKKRSPFPKTMVIGLANGRHGYLPTFEQHALGGYETWLGTNVVQENASVILTQNLLEMLGELKGNR
jgi:hypothetical protein